MKEEEQNAFPALHLNGHRGMTLRDYFAAKAMQIILKSKLDKEMTMCKDAYETHITEQSYSVADAMLKQREL